eukprot:9943057-Ditylum_brightwellii.AAC.1
MNKLFFAQQELEYLGYRITQSSIMLLAKKVAAIQEIQPPNNRNQLRIFIGIINFYRCMWKGRAERLAPLTKLCSKNQSWKWTDTDQKVFEDIKKTVAKNTLLLGATISQGGISIIFFSRKSNSEQLNYTTAEKELLDI